MKNHIKANRNKNYFVWQISWVLYCLLIFYISSLSHPPDTVSFPFSDKIKHTLEYLILALLTIRAFHKWPGGIFGSYYLIWAIIFCALYGASDEWHQSFVADRDTNIFDWVADVAGACIGGWLYRFYCKKKDELSQQD